MVEKYVVEMDGEKVEVVIEGERKGKRGIVEWDEVKEMVKERLKKDKVMVEKEIDRIVEERWGKSLYWSERDRVVRRWVSEGWVKRMKGRVRGRLVNVLVWCGGEE